MIICNGVNPGCKVCEVTEMCRAFNGQQTVIEEFTRMNKARFSKADTYTGIERRKSKDKDNVKVKI